MKLLNKVKTLVGMMLLLVVAACSSSAVKEDSSAVVVKQDEQEKAAKKGFDPIVHFDFDKSVIKSSEAYKITGQVNHIKDKSPDEVVVEGHTDSIGTKEYNIALGERRANSTKDALVRKGIAEDKLKVVSYGKESPLDSANTSEARSKNRRSVTVLK